MSRGGTGSASIVLVFAVLGLAIFTIISYMSALTTQTLIHAEVVSVQQFYAADVNAEKILAEILAADETPLYIGDIEIIAEWDWDTLSEIVSFVYPLSDTRVLHVAAAIDGDWHEILSWRVHEINDWETRGSLNVFQGFDEDFFSGW